MFYGMDLLGSLIPITAHAFILQCQLKLENRLRLCGSSQYLSISNVPQEFHFPFFNSKFNGFDSLDFFKRNNLTINLFKPPTDVLDQIIPNNACPSCITAAAGTRLARTFILVMSLSSQKCGVYNTEAFIQLFLHVASLDQTYVHCPIFPTAAS